VGLQRSRGASLRGSHLRQRADICHSGDYETTEEASLICHIAQACSEACDVEHDQIRPWTGLGGWHQPLSHQLSDLGFLGRRGVIELP
jgi:hypothetical protein